MGLNKYKMIVKNPTNVDIKATFDGKTYVVPAGSQLAYVKPEHAVKWKTNIHQFIVLEEETTSTKEVEVEEVAEEVEETPVTEAPVVEEKKSKKTK